MHAPLAPEKRILLRAADILRERGWCQRTIVDRGGRRCAIGAILAAAREYDLAMDAATDRAIGRLGGDVGAWNDAPERTAEEVIAAMERAALT